MSESLVSTLVPTAAWLSWRRQARCHRKLEVHAPVCGRLYQDDRLVSQVSQNRQPSPTPKYRGFSIKRYMGTDHKVTLNGKEYTPQQVNNDRYRS